MEPSNSPGFSPAAGKTRLTRNDALFIGLCLVVLVAGILVGLRYFQKAFPEATVDFRYDRAQTGQMAADFLADQGMTLPSDYRHVSRFGYDGRAKTYLEKELGVEGARPFLGHPVRLWYWQHRWFRPSTKEEFRVFVTPSGEIVRMSHAIEEQAAGANLAEAEARAIADRFLFGAMRQDSGKLAFLTAERIQLPNRTDWSFLYRATGIEPVKSSEYRYQLMVAGDKVSQYTEFLFVPEAWTASFNRLRSYNDMAQTIAEVGFLLTAIAIMVVLFKRLRRRTVQWKTAIWFGLIAAILALLNKLNELPLVMYGYDTTASWPGFLIQQFFFMLIEGVGAGLLIFLLTASAETVYREQYANKLSLPRMFSLRALRTKKAFKEILLGITLTSFFFAYQIAFYLIAGRFGAWSPSDVPYDNLLNTAMPWLAVLAIGFFPAVSEEFMSRMFSIPFLQQLFRNRLTWLAVLIPAVIWGFGHSSYPNEPFYIRGLEVGLAGIIIGIVMLRWGILATLVWHYTVDALYTAFLLFRSENLYFVLTAAVAAGLLLFPLLIALAAYLRKGSFLSEDGVTNEDVVMEAEPEPVAVVVVMPTAPVIQYDPLPRSRRILALGLMAAGILAALIPVAKLGDFLTYPASKGDAERVVARTLKINGWADCDTLKLVAYPAEVDNIQQGNPLVYLLKHSSSIDQFNRIAGDELKLGQWEVLAYKPEDRLKYAGSVDAQSGEILVLSTIFPEEMPGDRLSEDSARSLVESELAKQGEDLSTLEMKEHFAEARPNRLDHYFTYEAKDGDPRHVAEARYRRKASVEGNRVTVRNSPTYKVPEAWQRDQRATTALRSTRQALIFAAWAFFAIWAGALLVVRFRRGVIPWKRAVLVAILPTVIALLDGVNSFYLAWLDYFGDVEIPPGVFNTTTTTAWLISSGMTLLMFTLAAAFLMALFPAAMERLRCAPRRAAAFDGLLTMSAAIGAALIVHATSAWIGAARPDWITLTSWGVPEWLAVPLPAVSILSNILNRTLADSVLAGLFIYLWTGPARKPLLRGLLVIGLLLAMQPPQAVHGGEWFAVLLVGIIRLALAYLVLRYLVENRPVLLISGAVAMTTFSMVATAHSTGNGFVETNAAVVAVVMAISLYAWLWGGRRVA